MTALALRPQPMSAAAPASEGLVSAVRAVWRSNQVAPLVPLATPWVFGAGVREALEEPVRVILRAVQRLLEAWARDELPLTVQGLPAPLLAAAKRELSRGDGLGLTRLDVVCPEDAPHHFSLLEVQAGDPSGMGWHDALVSAARPHVDGTTGALAGAVVDALEPRLTERRVAFVVKRGSVVESDHRLLAAHARAHGWQVVVADPSELEGGAEGVRVKGTPVRAVFRDAWDELGSGAEVLFAAHAAGTVHVWNPFAAALADDKSWLEALSTRAHWDAATWRVLAAHVPHSRVLTRARLDAPRASSVLKPCDGYGGHGVVVGPAVSDADWAKALEAALERPHLVQRHVPLPAQPVTTFEGDDVVERRLQVVHSLWASGDALQGGFMRASADPVVNVHRGGGLAPVFFSP